MNAPRISLSPNSALKNVANVANVGVRAVTNIGSNISRVASNSLSSNSSSSTLLSGTGAMILIVLVFIVIFAIYYQTVGYSFQLGWEGLGWSRAHGEQIRVDGPGGLNAWMNPSPPEPAFGGTKHGAPFGSGLEKAVDQLESDVEAALSGRGIDGKQVFNINRNLYKFSEAEPLCKAFGAELATYDQVKDAYKAGADWCNYGWTKGQLALYPTQKETYDKLQQSSSEDERTSCGVPGLNGGYFPNQDQRFGVNCYGVKPAESALDRRVEQAENSDISYNREVAKFKAERGGIPVTPWAPGQWSE